MLTSGRAGVAQTLLSVLLQDAVAGPANRYTGSAMNRYPTHGSVTM